LRLGTPTQVSH